MTYIPDQSIVTWVGSWIPGFGTNPQESGAAVNTQLAQLGMKIASITWTGDTFFNVGQNQITYTMKVQTTGGIAYASENDVQSIIDHAIYTASGQLPLSSSITGIQLSKAGAGPALVTAAKPPCGTGFIDTVLGWIGQCTPPVQQASKSFSLSDLTSSGTLYIALALFGFIGALALIGYSGALKHGE